MLKRAKKYPVHCSLMGGSLICTLLLLTLAAWEMKLCLIASNMDHEGHNFSMYHDNFTTDLLFSSGILFFVLFILLAVACLKNAFDAACLLLKKDSIVYQKFSCIALYRNTLEEAYINRIIRHGYILKKKEKGFNKQPK